MTPSPNRNEVPNNAITTSADLPRLTTVPGWVVCGTASASIASKPPSPSLSARITTEMYFTAMRLSSAQMISDSTPTTFSGLAIMPPCPACPSSASRKAYSGLVPISPYTTPKAPSASRALRLEGDAEGLLMPGTGSTGTAVRAVLQSSRLTRPAQPKLSPRRVFLARQGFASDPRPNTQDMDLTTTSVAFQGVWARWPGGLVRRGGGVVHAVAKTTRGSCLTPRSARPTR